MAWVMAVVGLVGLVLLPHFQPAQESFPLRLLLGIESSLLLFSGLFGIFRG